jgi:hypothetical protein
LWWVGLVAAAVATAFLVLALTKLGTRGSAFDTALSTVGTVVAAVAAVLALRAGGERTVLTPADEDSLAPRRGERGGDDGERAAQEEARRARRADMTDQARWDCRLPDDDEYFCGRDELVTSLVEGMRAAASGDRPAVALLFGQPGVGTSSVASAAARDLRPDFPGGVFRVELRGLEPGARRDTAYVVELVARAAGLHLDSELLSHEQRLAALAARLRGGPPVLLVLDGARDAEHVARLVSPPIAAGIIVTSRTRSQGYVSRQLIFEVEPLHPDWAVRLLAMFTRDQHGELERLTSLAELCAYVPLALYLVGRRIQSGVPRNLDTLICWLKKARLDHLREGNDGVKAVRAAIRLSYDDLHDQPPVQRAFRLLSAAPGYAGTPAEMASGTGEPGPYEERLQTLADRSLAREETPYARAGDLAVTYSLYELVKDFARERLVAEERRKTIRSFERNSARFLRDRLREVNAGAGGANAADRLDPARYEAAEQLADERGWTDLAAELADGLHVLFLDRGEEDTAAAILDRLVQRLIDSRRYAAASAAALAAAKRLDVRGATGSAVEAATRAAKIARENGLAVHLALAEVKLSELLGRLDDWKGALAAGERAAHVLARLRPRRAAVPVLINNCRVAIELGRAGDAVSWARRATELADKLGSDRLRAVAAVGRGRAEGLAGNYEVAVVYSLRGGELFEALGEWANAGIGFGNAALQSWAAVRRADTCGLLSRAVDNWAKASGDRSRAHFLTALVDLSAALADDGRPAEAARELDRAVSLADDLGTVISGPMRYEARLRDGGMRLALDQPGQARPGAAVSDAVPDAGAPDGSGERLDPDVEHAADVLRQCASGDLRPDQAFKLMREFLRSPARHRADPFKVFLYSEPGELSARRKGPRRSRGR